MSGYRPQPSALALRASWTAVAPRAQCVQAIATHFTRVWMQHVTQKTHKPDTSNTHTHTGHGHMRVRPLVSSRKKRKPTRPNS